VKLSLRWMMVAVAVVALNFGLIRGAKVLTDSGCSLFLLLPAYALVPSLSLLTVAAVNVGLGLVKRRQAPRFATGYLLLGGLVSFGVCLALATQAFMLFAVTVRNPDPTQDPSLLNEVVNDFVMIAMLALPQIASGLIGGGLASWHGLTIVLGGHAIPPKGAMAETSDV
jgi:hypothetical protein